MLLTPTYAIKSNKPIVINTTVYFQLNKFFAVKFFLKNDHVLEKSHDDQ